MCISYLRKRSITHRYCLLKSVKLPVSQNKAKNFSLKELFMSPLTQCCFDYVCCDWQSDLTAKFKAAISKIAILVGLATPVVTEGNSRFGLIEQDTSF